MQRGGLFAGLAVLAIVFSGCSGSSEVRVIKLGHGLDPNHPVHRAMTFMAEEVDSLSSGRLRIDIYPSQQLGNERQLLELLQLGSLGITKVSSAVLEGFAPTYRVLSIPYLFQDHDHLFRVLEGEIGKQLLSDGERYWLRGLAFYDAGSRSFYTKDHPIRTPEDLKGLKIRTLESATQVAMVNRLGGSATPISWGEIYTSLQQGVVDGAENNPPSFYTSRHYEVCRYYSLDEHTAIPDVLLISTHLWNNLRPDEQQWLSEAAAASAQYEKVLWREATEEALRAVEEAGVEILYPDKSLFAAQVASIYAEFREDSVMAAMMDQIEALR